MIKSNVIFKSNLRVEDIEFMAWSLTAPDYSMLPLHMFEPFISGLKHGIPLRAVFKEANIRLNIFQNVSPEVVVSGGAAAAAEEEINEDDHDDNWTLLTSIEARASLLFLEI